MKHNRIVCLSEISCDTVVWCDQPLLQSEIVQLGYRYQLQSEILGADSNMGVIMVVRYIEIVTDLYVL